MQKELILGPPGTGKTTELLRIVGEKMDEGVHPSRIAFVSFTKKAANEAKERALAKFPSVGDAELAFFSTLHRIAFHRLHLRKADVLGKPDFKEIARRCGMEFTGYYDMSEGQPPMGSLEGDEYLGHYTLAGNKCISWEEHFEALHFDDRVNMSKSKFRHFDECMVAYKKETGRFDFNDFFYGAMKQGPLEVDVAIIDEAQDLTQLQWRYVESIFPEVNERYIAGDDDQAIYQWNGADTETFLHLPDQRRVLQRSFRLPRKIFEYSQKIIKRVNNRYEKDSTWDADREGTVTFHEDWKYVDIQPNESWLVLVRNAYQMQAIRSWLMERGLHFAIKGNPVVKQGHLRAIRSWLAIAKGATISVTDACNMYEQMTPMKDFARGSRQKLVDCPAPAVDWDTLQSDYGLKVAPSEDWWDALTGIHPDMSNYYRRVLRHKQKLNEPPTINLSTIHGAKGGEADNVLVLNELAWRTFKQFWRDEEEEHRVFYVAVTRAKENLHLIRSSSRNVYPWPSK